MKVKLFTHTDLDGVGCAIVGKIAFDDIDIEYCNYDEIDKRVRDFTASMQFIDYDKVFITDISISKDVADLVEYSITEKKDYLKKFQLIDHHNTAKWLNAYQWAFVDDMETSIYPKELEMKSSGTSMFYYYLRENGYINLEVVTRFAEKVRRYDSWEWSTKFNDNHAKELNDLFYIIGRDKFVERFIKNPNPAFTDSEKFILEIEQNRIDKYIDLKKKQMFESEFGNWHVGVVYAEQYQSQLGNKLALDHSHLDFIVMIDVGNGTVSYRGIHDHVDLGAVARQYGGGGHPKAAGSRSRKEVKINNWMDYLKKN